MEKNPALESLRILEQVIRKTAPGRTPSFTEAHVMKALESISERETIGRITLAKELGLGEGVTRTLLKRLRNQKIVAVSKYGIALSEYGKNVFADLASTISSGVDVPSTALTVGAFNIAVLVRDMAHKVKHGVEQRDAAIKAGASGATTLTFNGNQFFAPSLDGRDELRILSSLQRMLLSQLALKANDVIVIGSGRNRLSAEIGAKMAAIELLRSVRDENAQS